MRTFYSKADEGFLRKYYLEFSDEKLAKMFGKTKRAIAGKRFKLGLKRPPVNWGHGQPHPNYVNAKANSGSFKKGNVPHNTNKLYTETVYSDGIIWVKTENGMRRKHRMIWEANFGKIPPGHIVIFKDKNPLNCRIENLECISRAENIRRNRNYEKQSQTIKKTWQFAKICAEHSERRFWFKNKHYEKIFQRLSKN